MISGIDEAGKGPVIGPMCVAGVLIEEEKMDVLGRIGVKDSKQLTAKQREALAFEIKKVVDEYYVLEVSPYQIDELRKVMTMNEIMVVCYVKVLNALKPDRAFVDAADVIAQRFGENIMRKYEGNINITSEHKADEKYPVVSAASILAKVERDEKIRKLQENAGVDIGSGYPSDPKTIKFIEDWIREHGSLPDFARSSWETSQRLLEKINNYQRSFDDY